ncbi:MAG: von Willebrand factor type A domain-containing protein [Geitlerinemataceae cyanobacterium]
MNENTQRSVGQFARKLARRTSAIAIATTLAIGGVGMHLHAQGNGYPPVTDLDTIPFDHPDYLTLLDLAKTYGCPLEYADGSPVADRELNREEYYTAIEACDYVLNISGSVPQADLDRFAAIVDPFLQVNAPENDAVTPEIIGLPPAEPTPAVRPSAIAPPVGDTAVGATRGGASVSGLSAFDMPPVSRAYVGGLDREEYNPIDENRFQRPSDSPLSTFSIDVDGASYSNVRRFINDSQRPPADAVRIEELINYFTYDYPEPEGDRPFSISTEVSEAPWSDRRQLVHIGLQGKTIPTNDLPDSNLVFLLDVSGSMNSPDKLPLLKSAIRLLVNELDEDDTVSIVVYAGAAGVVLEPTPGDEKDAILDAIGQLEAGGSTAGGAGIELAYNLAKDRFIDGGNNRVLLATDGDFNVGTSSEGELIRLIEEKREDDIFLTVLGFGTGNLQDAKMEQLANHGNGNYAYIDSILEAKKVLVNEIGATLLTIAKDVKIQVEFNPAKVQAYRLVGYENRLLAAQDFNDDTRDAGELGAGHSVTALYEIIPVGIDPDVELPTVDDLRYGSNDSATENDEPSGEPLSATADSDELMWVKLRYKEPTADTSQLIELPVLDRAVSLDRSSDDFRFSAAVAMFGMVLRESAFAGTASLEGVESLARSARGDDRDGYRSEFLRLVDTYGLLAPERDR